MATLHPTLIPLDYATAATPVLLANLSGIALDGDRLWTVSDEGRTVECLSPRGDGYALSAQVALDRLNGALPGAKKAAEMDLESVDVAGDRIWICGSHCRVRRRSVAPDTLNDRMRSRPSRHLLGALDIDGQGGAVSRAHFLPALGKGSLRHMLKRDPYLAPFLKLPSKENGLDIEGVLVSEDRILLGLRGPLLDNIAAIVTVQLAKRFEVEGYELGLLDLGGLAIRDLCRCEDGIFVLAGPVSDAHGPYRLYHWQPSSGPVIQTPVHVFTWPETREKPEGICAIRRGAETGLIVLYDSPDTAKRVRGSVYLADWLTGV
ncbi:MAG TPA: DUF3616 domain-containing protein [Bradyrhizobium sp.]|nr:DUF3616 domain-containing protein [Bradyrhizobium sp.]